MKNRILKASAGTGKTYRLSLEYIKLLLSGVSYENIVVTTFTKKATQEIKDRILSQLFKLSRRNRHLTNSLLILGLKSIDHSKLNDLYKEILFNKSSLKIYTIDSFINNIFNQYVLPQLNIYQYKMIDEQENGKYIEILLSRLINSKESFNSISNFFSTFLEKDVSNYTKWLSDFIDNRWKFLYIEKPQKTSRFSHDLEKSYNTMISNLKQVINKKASGSKELIFYLKEEFQDLAHSEDVMSFLEKNYSLFFGYLGEVAFWNRSKLRRNKDNVSEYDDLNSSYQNFKQLYAAHVFNKLLIPLEKEIFEVSKILFNEYDKIKLKYKEFTHNDILIFTSIYMKKNRKSSFVGSIANSKNSYFLVDEFQDTSILQWNILKILIDLSKGFVGVGDYKQSIYSWRGGEKDLFANLPKILNCKEEILETCYRSDKNIIKFINHFFSNFNILDKETKYLNSKDRGYVEINVKDRFSVKGDIVAAILDRKINPKGTVILARTNSDIDEIAIYLQEHGIPYIKESSKSILDHRAVKPIFYLVKFINCYDFLDLLSFLRSDLVNISSLEMREIIDIKEDIELFFSNKLENLALSNKLKHILKKIKFLKNLDFVNLLSNIFSLFNIFNKFSNISDVKNINYFYKISKDFRQISLFIEYLIQNAKSDSLKQIGVDDANAIKLMTIHKSKGLEFETVILYWNFTMKSFNSRKKLKLNVHFDDDFKQVSDFCFTSSDMASILKYYGKNYQNIDREKSTKEEIFNLYVAMTRAKKNLLLFFSFNRNLKVVDILNNKNSKSDSDRYFLSIKRAILSTLRINNLTNLAVKPYRIGSLKQNPEFREQISENLNELPKISFNNNIEIQQKTEKYYSSLPIERAKHKGIIVHYFLSHIKYGKESEIKKAELLTLSKFNSSSNSELIKNLIDDLKNFVKNNEIFKTDKSEVFTEIAIFEGSEKLVIDRLVISRELKTIEVMDYKTGEYSEDRLNKYFEIIKKKYPEYRVTKKIISIDI